jgi:hypothetical protein
MKNVKWFYPKLYILGVDLLLLFSRDFHVILNQYHTAFVGITELIKRAGASKKAQKYLDSKTCHEPFMLNDYLNFTSVII